MVVFKQQLLSTAHIFFQSLFSCVKIDKPLSRYYSPAANTLLYHVMQEHSF